MIEARPLARLCDLRIRRAPPPLLLLPAPRTPMQPPAVAAEEQEWSDLRFFLACYGAGFLFFLIMLS